jgi:23S rRNA (adenine2503-C2)-methyltransferase
MANLESMRAALGELDALSAPPSESQPNVLGVPLEELERFVLAAGEQKFRATQVVEGLRKQRKTTFADITNLSKALRGRLEETFSTERPQIDHLENAEDGTRKYRFLTHDGNAFEAVYIPEVAKGSRTNTLCVSSQTGCAVGCKFCFTASLRRNRNLSAAEIVGQVLAVQDEVAALGDSGRVSNLVFMGMGEPLLNYEHVTRAIRILLEESGPAFPSRRITVSTSGIVPRIYDLGRDLPVQLAISLNATTDETRTAVMPINKTWGIDALIEAMRAYPLSPRRRVLVEYVLLEGVNDSLDDAKRLVKILEGLPHKVNLLPLNPHDRTPFSPPSFEVVDAFQNYLRRAGINVLRRTPRGNEISAACGQLGETVTAEAP